MPEKAKHGWKFWAATAAVLPVVYVLSLGPGLLLCRHNLINNDVYRVCYHPIFWMMDHEPLVRYAIEGYLGLW